MQISRPIIFIQIAATSLNVNEARIVQIATIKIGMDGSMEEKTAYIKPTVTIAADAIKVHGITEERVAEESYFKQKSKSLLKYFHGCDVGGFDFEFFTLPILMREFHLCGIEFPTWELNVVDVLKYEKRLTSNKLAAVYKRRTGKDFDSENSVVSQARASIEILFSQLGKNEEMTPSDIDLFCQGERKRFDLCGKTYINAKGEVCWAFGKNENEPVTKDQAYFNWVLNEDFPAETKQKLLTLTKQSK